MAYQFNLGSGQQLFVQQQGEQTAIALYSGSAGQQQQQQNTVTTGQWQEPPTLFRMGGGFILRLEGSQGKTIVQIQANGLQTLSATAAPNLANADTIAGQRVADSATSQSSQAGFAMEPMQPMKPMEPMKPMQMGNMSMQMDPMRMQMGDMKLEMGNQPASSSSSSREAQASRFCTQCGQPVAASDRFCAHCGHQLSA